MMIEILLVLGILGWLGWKAWSTVQGGRSPTERAVVTRGVLALGLVGFLILIGFVFMPMPFKLLFAIPAFLVSGSITKAFRDARRRIREEESGASKLERMKRIN